MEYNYTAIILKKKKIGETDRLYTFYTSESGKIQAIGRGIRKSKAKLAGHMETLNQSDVIVARRMGLGNIASAIAEQHFSHLKSDAFILGQALDTVAYFEQLVDFEEKDERLFLMLREYLMIMDQIASDQKDKARLITQGFMFKLLSHLGYQLDMRRCAISGEALSSEKKYCFSPDIGGMADMRHSGRLRRTVAIDKNAIKLIRIFFHNSLASLIRVQIKDEDLSQVERVSKVFLQWIER